MRTLESLKALAVTLGCADSTANVTGDTVDAVIDFINSNYAVPAVPATAGTYNLVVGSDGSATWTEV